MLDKQPSKFSRLWKSRLLQLGAEREGDPVAAGGGLLPLRWPAGHREVAGTAELLLAGVVGCSLGPTVSRVRFPGVSVEAATTAAPRWNKSS